MLNSAIISAIEDFAPAMYQESWDNTGVQVGSLRAECTGVLLCLDVTPSIVEEAHRRGCNLIISHHPLIFRGLKRLRGNTPVEEAVMRAISYGITVYSCHTAVDSTPGGVSYKMAEMLGASPVKVLSPLTGRRTRMTVTVNPTSEMTALTTIRQIAPGAQCYSNHADNCTLLTDADDPFATTAVGKQPCVRLETTIESSLADTLRNALDETIRADLLSVETQSLADTDPKIGLGVYALFEDEGVKPLQLVERVKEAFGSPVTRCTAIPDADTPIRRIAMCGGSGSEFISAALREGAQAFITSDTRYHDFVDYQNEIFIIDIGHFESESCTKGIFYNVIREKFPNFACYFSETEENPIKYI